MRKDTQYKKELDSYLIDPLVELAVRERPHQKLESDDHFRLRLKRKIHHSFNDFIKRFEAGIAALKNHKKWPHDERFKKASELLHDKGKLEEQIQQNKTLQEILHFTDQELASFYADGWEYYHQKHYVEASHIFLLLSQLNPKVGAFWSALGAAEEGRHELQDAMHAYLLAAELETHTLAPYLHGAKCLLLLNQKDEAKTVLKRAIERGTQETDLLKDQHIAETMLQAIK